MEWFIIIALFGLAIAGFVMVADQNSSKDAVAAKLTQVSGFSPERTLVKASMTHGRRGISLDSKSKTACLIVQDEIVHVPFSDILESEVIVDGTTVTKEGVRIFV